MRDTIPRVSPGRRTKIRLRRKTRHRAPTPKPGREPCASPVSGAHAAGPHRHPAAPVGRCRRGLRIDALDSRGTQARDHVSGDRHHQVVGDERPRIASVERHVRESDRRVPLCAQFTDHPRRNQCLKDEAAGRTPAQHSGQVFGPLQGLEAGLRRRQRGPRVRARIHEERSLDSQALQRRGKDRGKHLTPAEAALEIDLKNRRPRAQGWC
jgi:hypothetical protein